MIEISASVAPATADAYALPSSKAPGGDTRLASTRSRSISSRFGLGSLIFVFCGYTGSTEIKRRELRTIFSFPRASTYAYSLANSDNASTVLSPSYTAETTSPVLESRRAMIVG